MKSKNLSLLIAIGAVALVVAWTVAIHCWSIPDKWSAWGHTLVSTFASVMLGVVAAMWIYDFQKTSEEEANRKQLRTLLYSELRDSLTKLSTSDFRYFKERGGIAPNLKHDIFYSNVNPLILEEAGKSNLFESSHIASMLKLAREMRTYNAEVSQVHDLIFLRVPGYNPQALVDIQGAQIERIRVEIVNEAKSLLTKMDLRSPNE